MIDETPHKSTVRYGTRGQYGMGWDGMRIVCLGLLGSQNGVVPAHGMAWRRPNDCCSGRSVNTSNRIESNRMEWNKKNSNGIEWDGMTKESIETKRRAYFRSFVRSFNGCDFHFIFPSFLRRYDLLISLPRDEISAENSNDRGLDAFLARDNGDPPVTHEPQLRRRLRLRLQSRLLLLLPFQRDTTNYYTITTRAQFNSYDTDKDHRHICHCDKQTNPNHSLTHSRTHAIHTHISQTPNAYRPEKQTSFFRLPKS